MKTKITCKYDHGEIESLIAFAAQHTLADLSSLALNVKNCTNGARAGMAYDGVPCMSAASNTDAKFLVTLRIGDEGYYPTSNFMKRKGHPYGGKDSPLMEFQDWREGFVSLAAHEFHHIYQYQKDFPRSECEAEKAAFKTLEAFRQTA